jgi:hypothetical protein
MGRYRLTQGMTVMPESLANEVLTVLRPGRQKYRGDLSPAFREWVRDVEDAADEPPVVSPPTSVTWITASQAATVLDLSIRQTTALAPKLGGRKIGGRWMLNAHDVVEEREARSAAVGCREMTIVA